MEVEHACDHKSFLGGGGCMGGFYSFLSKFTINVGCCIKALNITTFTGGGGGG